MSRPAGELLTDSRVEGEWPLLEEAGRAFREASLDEEVIAASFLLGSEVLRIEAIGEDMFLAATRALSHLRHTAERKSSLTIRVREQKPGFRRLVSPDVLAFREMADLRQRSETEGRFTMAIQETGTLYVADLGQGMAYCEVERLASWPAWELASPFRALLSAWLSRSGAVLVHAACVGLGDQALLLAGPSGSGKSTTAMICALHGWVHYADDYTLVQMDDGITAAPLYNTAKLNPDSVTLLPTLTHEAMVEKDPTGKTIYTLGGTEEIATGAMRPRLAGIVFPSATGAGERAEPVLSPMAGGDALRLLAPSSLLQLSTGGAQTFARLAMVVRRLPSWRLELAAHPGAVAALLKNHLCGP
jgi:hypothetical protein